MRVATVPIWVYIMLIVMGVGFVIGSAAFVLTVPQPTGTIVGVIWLVLGAGMALLSLRALRGRRDDERIRRDGIAGHATLIAATTTGLTINNVPQWRLQMRVEGAGAPYEAGLKLLTFNPPQNGATFGVRIDPLRREHVVLAGGDAGASAPAAPPAAAPQIEAAIADALRQAGLSGNEGTTTTVNADGSRTISSTTYSVAGAAPGAAETVRLLAELERMRDNGSLGADEFDALKRKLLGEG